jgi:3-oxoadipate enol-lactonase
MGEGTGPGVRAPGSGNDNAMNGVLAHKVEGGGPPLLLLNGGMMTIASWEPVATALAERFTVVRCDFRGQLCSPGPPPADLDGHAADLVALLDHLALPAGCVVGTSFGAEVGIVLAASHPERVRALVLATATDRVTPPLRDAGPLLAELCTTVAAGEQEVETVWDAMLPLFYSSAYRTVHAAELAARRAQFARLPLAWFAGVAALLSSLQNLDLRPRLGAIRCPALVVAAEHDGVMPLERSRSLAAAIPGARFEIVAGSGHALVVERTAEFVERCVAFLHEVEERRGMH